MKISHLKLALVASPLVLLCASLAFAEVHSECDLSREGFYELNAFDYFSREVTPTEVAINAEGKKICLTAVPTGISESGGRTTITFENGLFVCEQVENEARISASKLTRAGVRIVGDFEEVTSNAVVILNCKFERI